MELEEMQRKLDALAAQYQLAWGLSHWEIEYIIDEDPEADCFGQCQAQPQYQKAEIRIFYEQVSTEEELEETLRHELEHVIESPYLLYKAAVEQVVNGRLRLVLEHLFYDCAEMTRAAIGRREKRDLNPRPECIWDQVHSQ